MNCNNCNASLALHEKFCGVCGHPVGAPALKTPPSGDYVPTQMMGRWKLTIAAGPGAGQTHAIGAVTRIGRGTKNEIQISDPQLSRGHAAIYQYDEGYAISDMGSANGTFVNGTRITEAIWIKDGDIISLGTVQLKVQGDPIAAAAGTGTMVEAPPQVSVRPQPQTAGPPTQPYAQPAPGPAPDGRIPIWLWAVVLLFGGLIVVVGVGGIAYFALRPDPTATLLTILPTSTVPQEVSAPNPPSATLPEDTGSGTISTPILAPTQTTQALLPTLPPDTLVPTIAPSDTLVPPTETPDFDAMMADANILLYEDVVGIPLVRYVQEALDGLGFDYVDVRDGIGDLQSQILSGIQWDLIIVSAEARSGVQGEFFDLLNDQLNNDVSVILEVWYLDDVASGRVSSLLTRCGVEFQRDWFDPETYSVYWYDPMHPMFQQPNTGISLINFNRFWTGDVGDLLRAIPGSDAEIIGGTLSTGRDQNGVLVSCLDGQLLIQTFDTHDHKRSDMVRLWQNYIYNGLLARFEE